MEEMTFMLVTRGLISFEEVAMERKHSLYHEQRSQEKLRAGIGTEKRPDDLKQVVSVKD